MSEPEPPTRPFYVTGGTLKPGEPSYVERRADTDLYESILAGEFCYVLTARQMGKSSLMARTAKRLEQAGVASAIVDLTQIGSERGDQAAAQWYFGIANLIHRQLGITAPLRSWWQERSDLSLVQRLTDFFRELVLANAPGRVVVFVDEIDSTIGLPFADDFFAALRACFNARATDDAFERLTFVLLGVATPDQLIQDPARTPFNIGKRIDLTDFRPDEARVLELGLHPDPGEAGRRLERVLHWTGGHPYLTQALCRTVREKGEIGTAKESVDPQVEELFLSSRAQREETNLKHARARLERRGPEGRRLLQLYRRVRQGKPVQDQPTSPFFAQLKLAGVVKATDDGRLAVRNRIYEMVFSPEWVKAAMPVDRGRQLAAATLAASLVSFLVWYSVFLPRSYEATLRASIRDDAYNVAYEAFTALRANPFSRSRAPDLMQEFWEQRALKYALAGKRDESLLSCLRGLSLKDNARLRRQARNLVGLDYERLRFTLRHADAVNAVAFSPDGRLLATGSSDGTACFWDAHTGKPLVLLQHRNSVDAVAFSPDGRTVVTGSQNIEGTAGIWDVRARKLTTLLQPQEAVNAVAFGPDGQTLATGSGDFLKLWDARTGKLLKTLLRSQAGVNAVAFSPDGRILATGSGGFLSSGAVKLWDARAGKLLGTLLRSQAGVNAVTFSPDGQILATGLGDFLSSGTAQLWDARAGKLTRLQLQHRAPVDAVAFSPDSQTLATGSYDTTQFWDARSGKPLAFTLQHKESVHAVAFSPDGRTFATGSGDNIARLWDARVGKSLAPPSQHEEDRVLAVAFSPDGRTIATGSSDGTTRLWDARTGKLVAFLMRRQGPTHAVSFSPDGRIVATGSWDNKAWLMDARTGEPLVPPLQHENSVYAVAFSPDGRLLATVSSDKTARLWDAHSGKLLTPPLQHKDLVSAVAFSPDSRTFATAASETVGLWDARSGKLILPLLHKSWVYAVTFSPDGRTIATGSGDTTVRFWDVRLGKPFAQVELQHVPRTIAFKPGGKVFFVATDHWLNTYSLDREKAVPQSSQLLHALWMQSFRFPPDCERCLQIALEDIDRSFHLETLRLDGPTDPPIEGNPKALLEKWQARLGLKFDEQMRPVPR